MVERSELDNGNNLCMQCGMCCGGRVFGSVKVDDPSTITYLENVGFRLKKDERGNSYFSQPCVAHRANCCAIYQNRPSACSNFRCKLLERYLAGEIAFDLAIKIVEECKQLVLDLEKIEYYGVSFHEKLVSDRLSELTRRLLEENNPTLRRAYADVAIRVFVLNQMIEANFKPAAKRASASTVASA